MNFELIEVTAMLLAEGREWAILSGLAPHEHSQFEERIVSIWARNARRGVLENLGTGFVVSIATDSKGRESIGVITAAHVATDALRALRPESLASRLGPFAHSVVRFVSPLIRKKELFVIVSRGIGPATHTALPVNRISINEDSDTCFLTALSGKEQQEYPRFAVDSDPLPVGKEVLMVGHSQVHSPVAAALHRDEVRIEIRREINLNLEMRVGKIIRVHERMRHKRVFGYETSIPMPGGMSGAPVFTFDEDDHSPLDVVGVCMSDATHGPSTDTTISGSSFVIGAQNLWSLPEPCSVNIAAWQKKREGRPPMGNFFGDHGQCIGELIVHIGPERLHVERRKA